MLKHLVLMIVLLFSAALSGSSAFGEQRIASHRDLNWNASRRWIHVDNVDLQKIEVFENARKQWLTTLRRDGVLLGDGRPLFWCARAGKVQTYFTFYPFAKWAEMDARREMIDETTKIVGKPAVDAYDTGDSALVPPHYSQMWRRDVSSDIVSSGSDTLTEVTATFGRLEFRQIDALRWEEWDEFEQVWKDVQAALIAVKYPLTCRVYANMFGNSGGENVLFWLAPDSAAYRNAPSIGEALVQQVGKEKSAEWISKLEKLFPVTESYVVERRRDLSNLGQ